jgi:hypothetical protein
LAHLYIHILTCNIYIYIHTIHILSINDRCRGQMVILPSQKYMYFLYHYYRMVDKMHLFGRTVYWNDLIHPKTLVYIEGYLYLSNCCCCYLCLHDLDTFSRPSVSMQPLYLLVWTHQLVPIALHSQVSCLCKFDIHDIRDDIYTKKHIIRCILRFA